MLIAGKTMFASKCLCMCVCVWSHSSLGKECLILTDSLADTLNGVERVGLITVCGSTTSAHPCFDLTHRARAGVCGSAMFVYLNGNACTLHRNSVGAAGYTGWVVFIGKRRRTN